MFAPENKGHLEIMQQLSRKHRKYIQIQNYHLLITIEVVGDVWIGLRNQKEERIFDSSSTAVKPFQSVSLTEKAYADGSTYTEGESYNFGFYKHWKGPCLHLEYNVEFSPVDTDCSSPKSFFCLLKGK